MLGVVLVIKGLTIVAPIGALLVMLCDRSDSPEDARYWAEKVKAWEQERAREELQGQQLQ